MPPSRHSTYSCPIAESVQHAACKFYLSLHVEYNGRTNVWTDILQRYIVECSIMSWKLQLLQPRLFSAFISNSFAAKAPAQSVWRAFFSHFHHSSSPANNAGKIYKLDKRTRPLNRYSFLIRREVSASGNAFVSIKSDFCKM